MTYDPRNVGTDKPTTLPMVLFQRQDEYVRFVYGCVADQQNGLGEKSRDVGATWCAVWASINLWALWDGPSVGWTSIDDDLLDKIDDPSSVLEKVRIGIRWLPDIFLPVGFNADRDMSHMRIVNPATGATIVGVGGRQAGRGGRTLVHFKDESSHYQHPEAIAAAISNSTRCQMDISSVSGLGTVFERTRSAGVEWDAERGAADIPRGKTRVFVFDWSDHPEKTPEWYAAEREAHEEKALLHVFAREVERNYAASVEGVIIPPHWVQAALDADQKLGIIVDEEEQRWFAALDVADSGPDLNALTKRCWFVLKHARDWGSRDTSVTARNATADCAGHGQIDLNYDCIGVGAGIKGEANRLIDDDLMPDGVRLVPWNAGAKVRNPEARVVKKPDGSDDPRSPKNKDHFQNLKAQAWFEARRRFEVTWRAITRQPGYTWKPDDLISISTRDIKPDVLKRLIKQISQPTSGISTTMKWMVNKQPEGASSPNLADSLVMNYWPAPASAVVISDRTLAWASQPRR